MAAQEAELRKGEFTLDSFRSMLAQTRKLGPMGKVMGMIPGMGAMKDAMGDTDVDGEMNRLFGIIDSMTPNERRNPSKVIDPSRRRRIAAGAGVQPHEVNDLVKQFDGMAGLMKEMAGMGMRDRMRKMQEIQRNPTRKPDQGQGQHRQTAHARRTAKIEKTARKGTPPAEITAVTGGACQTPTRSVSEDVPTLAACPR